MLAARKQPKPSASDDWIPITEAAALMGCSVPTMRRRALWKAKAAKALGRAPLAEKRRPESGGKPTWFIHRSFDKHLTRFPKPKHREERARCDLDERYPKRKADEAFRRAHWLQKWRDACRSEPGTKQRIAERVACEAQRAEPEGFAISPRSLAAWERAYYETGQDGRIRGVEALIDRRGLRPTDGASFSGNRSPEAVEYFYGLYRTETKPTIRMCHDMTRRKARAEGWRWPKSVRSTELWLDKTDDRALTYYARHGERAANHRFLPHIERDWSTVDPGSWNISDHKQVDFWVEHRGRQIRPWFTTVIDAASRCIVGWRLGPSPNQDSILAALHMAFRDWAIPETLYIDNGKDYASELVTGATRRQRAAERKAEQQSGAVVCDDGRWRGIAHRLGVGITFALPYSPQSKAIMERWYRTFTDQLARTMPSYCGNKPDNRPEALEAIRKGKGFARTGAVELVDERRSVPSIDQAREAIGQYIDIYHRRPHGGLDGQTPLSVWKSAKSLRRADPKALTFLMQTRGEYKVGANGVRVKIAGKTVGYGQTSGRLCSYRGRRVLITVDPADASYCTAWETGDQQRFIDRLEANERIPANTSVDVLREANAKMARRRREHKRVRRDAPKMIRRLGDECAAMRREEHAELLQATGTDGETPRAKAVRTGFEGASKPVKKATASRPSQAASLAKVFTPHARSAEAPRRRGCDLLRNLYGRYSGDDPLDIPAADADVEPASGF